MITQQELAKIIGVSQMTVSAILRGGTLAQRYRPELRRKVLETAAQFGYSRNEIALAVRNKSSNVIGFITQDLANGYSGVMLQGIVDAVAEQNRLVKTFSVFRGQEPSAETFRTVGNAIAEQCIGQRLAGVICFDIVFSEFLDVIGEKLGNSGIPLLVANGIPQKTPVCHGVYSDMKQGGELLFDYLYNQLHHERFALVGHYNWVINTRQILQAFLDKASATGIPQDHILLRVSDGVPNYHDLEEELLDFKPTAVWTNSDFSALSIITSLTNRDYKVPDKFSVIGYGNLHFDEKCYPAITSLDNNLYDIGYRAAQLLYEHGNGRIETMRTEFVPHTIVKRESCKIHKNKQ